MDLDEGAVKMWLNEFCQKMKVTPKYTYEGESGTNRFICRLQIDGFPYEAVGMSTTKKDAKTSACRDFVTYLKKRDQNNDVPSSSKVNCNKALPQFQPPPSAASSSSIPQKTTQTTISTSAGVSNEIQVKDIDGGWTLDNAKQRLHEWLQKNGNQSADYRYRELGPDHNK